jgi:hypothetical protein
MPVDAADAVDAAFAGAFEPERMVRGGRVASLLQAHYPLPTPVQRKAEPE